MKCKNCAANYSSNEPACPYCGTENSKGEAWILRIGAERAEYEETLRHYGTSGRLLLYDRILSRVLIGMILFFVIVLFTSIGIQQEVSKISTNKNAAMLEKLYTEERFGEIKSIVMEDNFDRSNSRYKEYSDMTSIYFDYEKYTQARLVYFQKRDTEISKHTAAFLLDSMHSVLFDGVPSYSNLSDRNRKYLTEYQKEVTDFAINELGFSDTDLAILAEETIPAKDEKKLKTLIIEKEEAA